MFVFCFLDILADEMKAVLAPSERLRKQNAQLNALLAEREDIIALKEVRFAVKFLLSTAATQINNNDSDIYWDIIILLECRICAGFHDREAQGGGDGNKEVDGRDPITEKTGRVRSRGMLELVPLICRICVRFSCRVWSQFVECKHSVVPVVCKVSSASNSGSDLSPSLLSLLQIIGYLDLQVGELEAQRTELGTRCQQLQASLDLQIGSHSHRVSKIRVYRGCARLVLR